MFTDEELYKIETLCREHPEFRHIMRRFKEESRYMLSSISHELRNPITLIHSTVQLMEKKNPEITQIPYWSQLRSDINYTISILEEYTNYNHSEEIRLSNVDLYELIDNIKNNFRLISNDKNINICLDASDISRKHIKSYSCDEIKMKQVFINIIKNAIEAISKKGFIHIEINADPALLCKNIDGNTYMVIIISNNGKKIEEDELPNIFEPFVTYKAGGTGLGLAIASRVISSHGGNIQAFSDDEITSFHIMLPLL
ncbi:phospho-acceptor domain-containing protein [Mobilisporobacter senegalensis]|uniref:histidine kinase n=1 Tax=Mobilisporobacter senegalensis TaxID=1329262 RepID=A0A3N1XA63_9FIRM|nr:ATP-binding protein [Mobilisporobacter senegalensis]ROR23664.1 phospho-acceptor domain-containing protein [Mobilisporobacter senegalensis]